MHKPTFIDLFAGAGGLSEGFIRAGFDPIAHVEMNEAACYTLKTRTAFHYLQETGNISTYNAYLRKEINRDQLYRVIPEEKLSSVINLAIGPENNRYIFKSIEKFADRRKVDMIIGGPPCQAYSLVGRARDKDGMRNDPRNYLYREYGKYLARYQPKMFVFENVPGLLSANGGQHFKDMQKYFRKLGYEMQHFKVDASNYGVLQNRKRIIILGFRKEIRNKVTDLETTDSIRFTSKVENIFSDLPAIQAGDAPANQSYSGVINSYLKASGIRDDSTLLTHHIARPHTNQDKEIYRLAVNKWNNKGERLSYKDLPRRLQTHKNKDAFLDRFKVVGKDEFAAQTIVAHIAKDGHYYIHPNLEQNRSITVREAARIQSFPDTYYFEGVDERKNRTAAFQQVGNAVPPILAKHIAATAKTTIR